MMNLFDTHNQIPKWAMAENMEQVMSLEEIWKLDETPKQTHKYNQFSEELNNLVRTFEEARKERRARRLKLEERLKEEREFRRYYENVSRSRL